MNVVQQRTYSMAWKIVIKQSPGLAGGEVMRMSVRCTRGLSVMRDDLRVVIVMRDCVKKEARHQRGNRGQHTRPCLESAIHRVNNTIMLVSRLQQIAPSKCSECGCGAPMCCATSNRG